MKNTRDQLLQEYDKLCTRIADVFLEKQFPKEYNDEPQIRVDGDYARWIGDEAGSVLEVGDMYNYNFDDILTDLREDAPTGEMNKYYDYEARCTALGLKPNISYRSWIKGAPRHGEKMLSHLENLKCELDRQISELNNNPF